MLLRYIKLCIYITALAAVPAAALSDACAGDFPHISELSNGLKVSVYRPEEILESMTFRDGAGNLVFRPEGGGEYILIEDISHPAVINRGDGSFHPFDEATALEALASIDVGGRRLELEIDLYVLPLPRLYSMGSSCSGRRIFLSPGTWEVCREVCFYVVTHEAGHRFQDVYAPCSEGEAWNDYLDTRGIKDDPLYATDALCRWYKPQEIFAEDFRFLFGGDAARYTGTIENPDLPAPDMVEGLAEFYVSLLTGPAVSSTPAAVIASAVNYPNPFNPVTTIRALLAEDSLPAEIDVRIYAADGSLVRDLYSGPAGSTRFEVVWDGRDDRGAEASSGVYFYRVRAGAGLRTGKMLLVR